ncbi:MAG: hypothetical protein CMJ62_19800 [Planctomycetaceae bacterium]|nr:hypothetical protein [Planctomycetaceae bacterium]
MNGFELQRVSARLIVFAVCLGQWLLAAGPTAPVLIAADWLQAGDLDLKTIVVGQPEQIMVHPERIVLRSNRLSMHVIVTGVYEGGDVQDLTRAASFSSSDESVMQWEAGVVKSRGNGQAILVVTVADQSVEIPVTVSDFERPMPQSFQFETLAVVTKNGCNSGACHGSPSGKGGFRLSLLAYDAELDKETLIREAFGRRTNTLEPKKSLLLQKPLMKVSHGGGKRLRISDTAYKVLEGWIREGCQVDPEDAPQCVKLEVLPGDRLLRFPAHSQQLVALAHFSDGTTRDVTGLAKFSSSDTQVASVAVDGLVAGHVRGQAAILVRFLEKVETVVFTFVEDIEGFKWNDSPENNFIDTFVNNKLNQLQYLPSELCTDDEFMRRLYLDVLGILPAIDEVQAFLDNPAKDKREQLIEVVLQRPEYAKFWALRWGDLLKLNEKKVTAEGMHKYYEWIVRSFAENVPFDQFCRDLLTAEGSTYHVPAANFYRTAETVDSCAETSAQLFMGVRIQCAKCHNHPFERWTQNDYVGLTAFFNRINRKQSGRTGEMVVWTGRRGEVSHPRTGESAPPSLPLTGFVDENDTRRRRAIFAEWLTADDNPFFSKVAVNRIWAHVMGRGIVEPVDDFRDSNPPSNVGLLEALAKDFRKNGYDQKHVLGMILKSHTYQRSSQPNEFNQDDEKLFSHCRVRLLGAEQLLDAICHMTSVPENFDKLPAGTLATQLPGPRTNHEFLKVFGQPERETACACERSNDSNLSQALALFNGPLIHGKLKDESNRFRQLIASEKSNDEVVSQLYLAALCRPPYPDEMKSAIDYLDKKEDRVEAMEDVCWALLNTNEFLFQH